MRLHTSRGHHNPTQEDTIAQLDDLLTSVPHSSDTLVLLGDFNARLSRLSAVTGKYAVHANPNSGGKLMQDLLLQHNMIAASTCFKPSKRATISGYGAATVPPHGNARQIDYICVSARRISSVISFVSSIRNSGKKKSEDSSSSDTDSS